MTNIQTKPASQAQTSPVPSSEEYVLAVDLRHAADVAARAATIADGRT